jgi:hypothetical protein
MKRGRGGSASKGISFLKAGGETYSAKQPKPPPARSGSTAAAAAPAPAAALQER